MKKRHVADLSIAELAALGAEAGREAVDRARKAGLPITGTKDGQIVRTYPDGRQEVLKDLRKAGKSEEESV
jgi:hypothetical protein